MAKKMKIGIITFWDTQDNYGQVLQNYALITFLKNKGYKSFLVKTKKTKYKTSVLHKLSTFFSLVFRPQNLLKLFYPTSTAVTLVSNRFIDRNFDGFRQEYIPSTNEIYTYEDLCEKGIDADVMICGSDQVWSFVSPLMFLQFPGSFKRIAYAASFGGFKVQNLVDKRTLKKWLKTFDLISVREKDGVEICNSLDTEALLVPDPTLLLERERYEKLFLKSKSRKDSPYILLYLLGNQIDIDVKAIYDFAENNGIRIVYVASQGREDKYNKEYPSIESWLDLVCNAKYMITNSFHGTVFALTFNIPFISILLTGNASRMNHRIEDLLSKYDLKDRIYKTDMEELFRPVDFSKFNKIKEADIINISSLFDKYLENKDA